MIEELKREMADWDMLLVGDSRIAKGVIKSVSKRGCYKEGVIKRVL